MNSPQSSLSKSTNGFGRRRSDRELGMKLESKVPSNKFNQNRSNNAASFGKAGTYECPSRDRVIFLLTSLIGHPVEVQLKNGSVYSGIYYTTNIDKDFAVVLKMARMIKDASLRGQNVEFISKPPSKTLIIPGKEVVQVIAKDANIVFDGSSTEFQRQKQQDLMTDSLISKSRSFEAERELTPWVPDEGDTQCPELENIFDNHWNRSWNQFEANEALFGVKSTFDEELYTTKLEKGPWMREIEREAMRIAKEIEGEATDDLHLAEERGVQLNESLELDEETKYSAVYRGGIADDSGFDDVEDGTMDSRSSETFGVSTFSSNKILSDLSSVSPNAIVDDSPCSESSAAKSDTARPGAAASASCSSDSSRSEITERLDEQHTNVAKTQKPSPLENSLPPKSEKTAGSDNEHAPPSSSSSRASEKAPGASDTPSANSRGGQASSSTSSSSDQEFKLNPNAKSFTPSRTTGRPLLPENSFYYPAGMAGMPPHMHGLPMGIGPSFPHQPVVFNGSLPPLQTPPVYFHPGAPQYGQQMVYNQGRGVMYVPSAYQPEMPYKGRDF